jgi:hypothetical protein
MFRRKRRIAARDPQPWLRRLPPELRDNPKSVAWAKSMDKAEQARAIFQRRLMDFYELHRLCPHPACRRAHKCVHPALTCYKAVEPDLRTSVFPRLDEAVRQVQAEAQLRRSAEGEVASPDERLTAPDPAGEPVRRSSIGRGRRARVMR